VGGARRFGRALREIPGTWRRSLQLRVVTATMLLSVIIALALGWVLDNQIRDGLVHAKEKSSAAHAANGIAEVQSLLTKSRTDAQNASPQAPGSATSGPDKTWPTASDIIDLVNSLCVGASDNTFQVLVTTPTTSSLPFGSTGCTDHQTGNVILPSSVPSEFAATGQLRFAPTQLYFGQNGINESLSKPGLIYGQSIPIKDSNLDTIDLYYAFPFDSEQQALTFDGELIAGVGSLLVLALGGVAWFVTRQVVVPVRQAAGIAERLADGRLDERMRVRGEDDLARLASSFNAMATNLQNQIRRLEELSRVQRRFVSDVSHELRTPLTTVRMAADVLHDSREDFDAPTSRSAELLQTQLDRFEELLSDLLEISRFDAGAAVLESEPIDLRNLVHRVVESNAVLAERRESDVNVVEPGTPCVAEIDPRRIERILRNLVVNAIEHSEGRPVVVKVSASDDAVAVAVRDYGVGLKPGESSLVFGRFWRADPARARTTGGTGLGLAISLEDARLHHGWLQAWGEPGGGSQFRLTLPRTAGAELLRSPIPLEPDDSRHHRRQAENIRHVEADRANGVPAAARNAGPDLTNLSGRSGGGAR
jgi:two-component system sensor histidine kinase MtrB